MSRPDLFDAGLQPERTLLAWRRTVLATAIGALVCARMIVPALGYVAFVPAVISVCLAVVSLRYLDRRFKMVTRTLIDAEDGGYHLDGRLPILVTAMATALGFLALTFVLGH